MEPGTQDGKEEPTPPVLLRIGVTGHRRLPCQRILRRQVRRVLRRLDRAPEQKPYTLVVVSPLAEGADRLVAEEVLAWSGTKQVGQAVLEVVLPLPEENYLQDFPTTASKDEFLKLIAQARSVEAIHPPLSRPEAYEQVGRYVVDHCDVLIALWDGKPSRGQGGTAEIVEYARKAGRPLFWIHTRTGRIHDERRDKATQYLEVYDYETVGAEAELAAEDQYANLSAQAEAAGLAGAALGPLKERLLPEYVRADLLATRYQNRFTRAGTGIYALAALAVAVVPVQMLFLPQLPQVLWVEVVAMGSIIALLWVSHRGDWHRKWIDYRFLAERLRAGIFLCVAGVDSQPLKPPLPPMLSLGPDEWLVKAFERVWEKRPPACADCGLGLDPLKRFLLVAWIQGQVAYYTAKGHRHRQRYELLERVGAAVFALTLVACILHAWGTGHPSEAMDGGLPGLLASAAIVLPAVGTALAGIRIHREYQRNAERYRGMVGVLSQIGDVLEKAPDRAKLTGLLEQANDVMLRENQDWRVVFGFQKLTV